MNPHNPFLHSLDLNQAPLQLQPAPLIPVGTLVKVMLQIQPGNFGENGWLTHSQFTESVYLKIQLKILEGEYKNRVIYERIGIQGTKQDDNGNDIWGTMGRSQLRAMIESAYGISPNDQSEAAQKRRQLSGFQALNGLVFMIKVGKEKKQAGSDRQYNNIAQIITPDMSDYPQIMGAASLLGNEGLHDAAIDDFFREDFPVNNTAPVHSPDANQSVFITPTPPQDDDLNTVQASLERVTNHWDNEIKPTENKKGESLA